MEHRSTKCGATLAAVFALACGGGCGVSDLSAEFRAAAGGQLQTGVTALLNGLVDGAFAVLEPGDPTDTDNSAG
ncbi:MAG: hypothetical protein IID37_06540 [Planctomycetes bacterium]|nr:hypothetical protein [Planctomycetota bacterium]